MRQTFRGGQNKERDRECNGPQRLTPSVPFLSFLKQNLQLISLHCKDRPQFTEGTLQNIYARPDAKTLIKNMCSSKDPSERIKTLQMDHFQHIIEEIIVVLKQTHGYAKMTHVAFLNSKNICFHRKKQK